MVKVIWAPSALEDIDAIAEFISRDSIGKFFFSFPSLVPEFSITDHFHFSLLNGAV